MHYFLSIMYTKMYYFVHFSCIEKCIYFFIFYIKIKYKIKIEKFYGSTSRWTLRQA